MISTINISALWGRIEQEILSLSINLIIWCLCLDTAFDQFQTKVKVSIIKSNFIETCHFPGQTREGGKSEFVFLPSFGSFEYNQTLQSTPLLF